VSRETSLVPAQCPLPARFHRRYASPMPDEPALPPGHPNGPRTFANTLRDNVPMPTALLDRLAAAEQGRHPALSEVRAALGLEVSIEDWGKAAQDAWPPRGAEA